ncbi:MAG: c-type cytochrome [Nonlabens sp.]|uniref:c-type cytochrome n=1 Tax=Nonlabens sp. TaxID=1888209 RepID=UPI003EF74607
MKHLLIVLLAIALTSCGNSKKETATTPVKEIEQSPLEASVARGKEIYSDNCVSCHMTSGKGVAGAFPPLNPSNWLTEKRTESIHALKYGLKGPIEVNGQEYNNIMLSLGLEDQEIADVMNYTIQTWNSGDMVTEEEVKVVEK